MHEDKPTLKSLCYPTKYKLLPSQKEVAKIMQKQNGLLVYHKVGAGKTCAAIQAAEKWKDRRKIIVVTAASLIDSFYRELRTRCVKDGVYVYRKERKILEKQTKKYDEVVQTINKRIDKVYNIYSYHNFVTHVDEIDLRRSILVIDEVQNIVSFTGKFYKKIYEAILSAPASLRVVLLSATPISDQPAELGLTLNLLRPPKPFPMKKSEFEHLFLRKQDSGSYRVKNLRLFKSMAKGLISYNAGANRIAFPSKKIYYVRCKMTSYQYKCYRTVYTKEGPFRTGDILNLSNQFYMGCRMLSNVAFPEHATKSSGLKRLAKKHLQMQQIKKVYSPKFYRIVKSIKACHGPVFVYSTFKGPAGVEGLVKILNAQGYKNYYQYGTGIKRYAVWTGETPTKHRIKLLTEFNKYNNRRGNKIKVIFGTPAMKEGVSLKRVRQVHITEPHWNHARLVQVMGRAVRFCSHKDLPYNERKVDIYIYISTYPREEIVDEYIHELANKKDKLNRKFLRIFEK